MTCPHCESTATSRRVCRTALGYRRFNCRSCQRRFNERTGSPFNDLHFPTDVVLFAVMWRLRYKLGFRDVAELMLQRGHEVTHETIRSWEFRFAPLLADKLRATDRDGQLIDSMLSDRRDKHAARKFLRRLVEIAERKPLRVTTDQRPACRRAIRWTSAARCFIGRPDTSATSPSKAIEP